MVRALVFFLLIPFFFACETTPLRSSKDGMLGTMTSANLYVAPDGRDRNPGTESRPFATLTRARDAIRVLKPSVRGPITVWVRGGVYRLSEPLVFDPQDSGSQLTPVTYRAMPGERPVLSGGVALALEWEPYRDGIFRASLAEPGEAFPQFTQLFVNGRRQFRARYPNHDPEDVRGGYIQAARGGDAWPHTEFEYDPETFTPKRWKDPSEAIVHIFPNNYWGNMQFEVKEIDYEKNVIRFSGGGFQLNEVMQGRDATGIGSRSRFYVENVFEELDAPGEWYLDTNAGVLYAMPPEGVNLSAARVEAVVTKQLVEFRGTQREPVQRIELDGFQITQTRTTFLELYEAPSLGDWTIHRGGAVFMEGTEDCAVKNCFFDQVGGNALFINLYNRRATVSGNKIGEAGESGVCLVGNNTLTHGSQRLYPADCVVSNNSIHDIGVFGKQTAGVFISVAEKINVAHNEIVRMPRAAVCINDGTWGGHIIEFNKIHDTVRETGDHGPFNSWGRERFWCLQQSHGPVSHAAGNVREDAKYTTIIRNNFFRDYHGWGIDLDDGSSNYHVVNNLCVGISVKLREGDYRTVENNIFVNPANPPGIHVGYENNHDRIVRNIIVTNTKYDNPETDVNFDPGRAGGEIYQLIYPPREGPWFEEVDYNLFFSDAGEFFAGVQPRKGERKRYDLEEWRSLGFDRHSLYSDPLFVDPASGDFRLRPESPALKLGFEPFDMGYFGLLPDFQW